MARSSASASPRAVSIFAGGEACSRALDKLLRFERFTVVLDGAAEAARRQRWLPNLLLGDFDSVSEATLRHFARRGVPIMAAPDQNQTDLEKALAWCALRDVRSVWIAQAFGGRVDHSFTNLALLRRFHAPKRELLLLRDQERVRFVRDETLRLRGRSGRAFAVLPFPACRVTSSGLAYEMENCGLELGIRESTSNRARRGLVQLQVKGEALLVEGF